MSTNKSIKIQKNKVLTYSINKPGFKTVYGSRLVALDQTININLKNTSDVTEPYQLGDRLFGISSFVDYFTPDTINGIDKDSLKYISAIQTTGTGLSNIQVIKGTSNTAEETGTWLSKVEKDLQIITIKGTSKTFIFTYNGSTWDITGDLTLSGQNTEDYGISFTGTPTNGDVITVVETQYNKFAFFVLDANYRTSQKWATVNEYIMPKRYSSNPQNCIESATYYNQYVFNNANLNNYPIFNHFKNYGNFILTENIKINALVPNGFELQKIFDNRIAIDSFDPITIENPSASYNLTNWNYFRTCLETTAYNTSVYTRSSSSWTTAGNTASKGQAGNTLPIFEVPVM